MLGDPSEIKVMSHHPPPTLIFEVITLFSLDYIKLVCVRNQLISYQLHRKIPVLSCHSHNTYLIVTE